MSCSVVSIDGQVSFMISYVYMKNEKAQRAEAWAELRECVVIFGSAWVVLGDCTGLVDLRRCLMVYLIVGCLICCILVLGTHGPT